MTIMKRFISIIICIFMITMASNTVALANDDEVDLGTQVILQVGNPYMLVNGESKEVDPGQGTAPITYKGTTFLPIKALITELGGNLNFTAKDQKITINLDGINVQLQIGSKRAVVNGVAKSLGVAPMSIKGRTMVPIRFVTDNLKMKLKWDSINQRVTLYHGGNIERWYEDNYTVKINDKYGLYTDQSMGYSMNYSLSWGEPLVVQFDEGIETRFYESKNVKISSYIDYMQSSYDVYEGLVLNETYIDFLKRRGFLEGAEIEELVDIHADKAYGITLQSENQKLFYIVTFKEDQVGVFIVDMHNFSGLTATDVKVIREFTDLFENSFELNSSVG